VTSILVLLALLSVASLASRRGSTETLVNLASAPLLVSIGLLLSPEGLGFLLPSTAASLTPGLRVGVAWLALLIGLRSNSPAEPRWGSNLLWFLGVGGLVWAVGASVCFAGLVLLQHASMRLPGLLEEGVPAWAMAAALGGMMSGTSLTAVQDAVRKWPSGPARERLEFLARHDAAFGVMTLVLLLSTWVTWKAPDAASAHALPILAVLALGAVMAAGALMLGAGTGLASTHGRLSLVALLTTGAGLCGIAGVPEAGAAWVTGLILAALGANKQVLSQSIRATERPARLVLLVLAGVHTQPEVGPILVGVILCAGRMLGRVVLWLMARPLLPATLPFQSLLTAPALSVPFAMSLTLARRGTFDGTSVLTAVVTAVCLNDLLTLLWGFGVRARAITYPSLPVTNIEAGHE